MAARRPIENDPFPYRAKEAEQHDIDRDPHVERALGVMEEAGSKLDQESHKQLDDLLDRYSDVLSALRNESDSGKRTDLLAQRTAIRNELEGSRLLAENIDRELNEAEDRQEVLERAADRSLAAHPLGVEHEPEDPSTPQAALFEKFYSVSIFSFDTVTDLHRMMKKLGPEEQDQVAPKVSELHKKRMDILSELNKYKDIAKHPEQLPVEQWDDLLTRLQDTFEELLLVKRDLVERLATVKEARRKK